MASHEEEIELSNCITVSRTEKTIILKTPAKPRKVKEPTTAKTPAKPKKLKEPKKHTTAIERTEDPTPKPKKQKTKEPDRKIIAAVDLGTTFTGIAWAQTRKPDVRTLVFQWPDGTSDILEGFSNPKVPTEIAYDGENYKWGFEIEGSGPRHQFFKLDLDPSQVRESPLASDYLDHIRAQPGYDPPRLTTDYLTAIRAHFERLLRYKILKNALLSIPIEYIITVPAVWSDKAQAQTRACADAAGMGKGAGLHMISEPEAAAVYALNALEPHCIKTGDTFTICDAGGGTVDLITYKVIGLKPTLKLAEASAGSGSLCGSSFLNRGFQEFLEKKLGNEPGWDEEVLEEAMTRFEKIVKRHFRGTVSEEFHIPVPGLQDNKELRIRKNKMTLAGTEVMAIFNPVVNEVLKLVTGQITAAKRHVKAVILVGGFGENTYLRDAIRERVKPGNVEVLQSSNSWTAVVEGALMKGLASTSPAFATVKISERSARKHYGINTGVKYLEREHGEARKIWDACSGCFRTYTLEWFIKKGNLVKEDDPVRLDYQRKRLVSRGPFTTISTIIYYSSDPQNLGAPKYVEDESVKQLVKVEADLSCIPENKIPKMKGADEKMYYTIDYAIQITYKSAYTLYELIYRGANCGVAKSEYV